LVNELSYVDVNLKEAVKKFAKRFASGCCVNEEGKIEI